MDSQSRTPPRGAPSFRGDRWGLGSPALVRREVQVVELPEGLAHEVTILECESLAPSRKAYTYVLGTAHVSKESCNAVRQLVRLVQPDVVFVELCAGRTLLLTPPEKLKVPTASEMWTLWLSTGWNSFGVLYSWFLAKVAAKMDIHPGEEFRVAYEEAVACGARVKLGDRPIQVTLGRTWAAMSLWAKLRLLYELVSQAAWLPEAEELAAMMEDLKNTDVLTLAIKEMSKKFPSLMVTLVDERDQYMAHTLRETAQHSSVVVAVVGKGHQRGIKENWDKDIDVAKLMELPPEPAPWFSPTTKRVLVTATALGSVLLLWGLRAKW